MSCFSIPFSTGSQHRVTDISDSSTMVGMPAVATLKVAMVTMWVS